MRAFRLTLVVLAGATLLAAGRGAASDQRRDCSCFPVDVRRALAQADAAFVGVALSKKVDRWGSFATFTFRVERAVKGKLPRLVRVRTAPHGAACGLEARRGTRLGLFLFKRQGGWSSTLCLQVTPKTLLDAARPLPRPDGSGPIRFLVGGSFYRARDRARRERARPAVRQRRRAHEGPGPLSRLAARRGPVLVRGGVHLRGS